MLNKFPGYSLEIHDDETDECIARAMVIEYDDGYFVDSFAVNVSYQGKGYGSQLLMLIIEEYSDVRLYLQAESYGSQRLNDQSLKAWYSRYGFVQNGVYMERLPTCILQSDGQGITSQQSHILHIDGREYETVIADHTVKPTVSIKMKTSKIGFFDTSKSSPGFMLMMIITDAETRYLLSTEDYVPRLIKHTKGDES